LGFPKIAKILLRFKLKAGLSKKQAQSITQIAVDLSLRSKILESEVD
jgi:hypothetical protein